ncbi:MAG: helix-turn-helix transcriptional regulator [Rhizobiales bacterium]|nr:helix-turn-helix transcriptional regulator [Hyphomicrobiales bacterium]
MTPFGEKMRKLRAERGMTLRDMAENIGVSSAYLSALEHGKRGRPGWHLIQRIISHFNIIWDEAEEVARLARISHPRVTIDTSGLDPKATELANRLADDIAKLDGKAIGEMLAVLDMRKQKGR